MKFTTIALLAIVGVAAAGKPQLSVRKDSDNAELLLSQTQPSILNTSVHFSTLDLCSRWKF